METNQLLSKTTILHAFSIIRHVIDVSHNLNSNLTWIYLKFFWVFHRADWDFTALVTLFYHKFVIRKFSLPFSSLVMETNSFTRLKFHTPISNLKLKNNGLLSETFTFIWGVPQGCRLSYCSILLWLRYLPSSLMLCKD